MSDTNTVKSNRGRGRKANIKLPRKSFTVKSLNKMKNNETFALITVRNFVSAGVADGTITKLVNRTSKMKERNSFGKGKPEYRYMKTTLWNSIQKASTKSHTVGV